MNKWHKVEEELPEDLEYVLEVTHWRRFPKLGEQDE